MITALINGRVLTDYAIESNLAVLIENGNISAVVDKNDKRVRNTQQYDLLGRYLLPGFIDCQVNGGGGVLFNDVPTVDTLRRIATAHRCFGTTGLLPTLISADTATMHAAITAANQAIAQNVPGILGIHLEGPYLSPERKGVHNSKKFHVPDAADIDLVCSLATGRTLLTLAPERVPLNLLRELVTRGIIIAAGHTAADYAQTRAALDAGLRGFTHLFNAMSPLTSREPGVVGAALEDANSWCGIIVDGYHVHPTTLRVAMAAKRKGKMFLITDAMPPVGSDQSSFYLNGEAITCRNGLCATAQGTLAGSALDMATALRNIVHLVGIPLAEAARMASTYPAEFLGLGTDRGRIAVGYRADLVSLNDDLTVHKTWITGTHSNM